MTDRNIQTDRKHIASILKFGHGSSINIDIQNALVHSIYLFTFQWVQVLNCFALKTDKQKRLTSTRISAIFHLISTRSLQTINSFTETTKLSNLKTKKAGTRNQACIQKLSKSNTYMVPMDMSPLHRTRNQTHC